MYLHGVDTLGSLCNVSANGAGNELVDQLLEIRSGSLLSHNFNHLLANLYISKGKDKVDLGTGQQYRRFSHATIVKYLADLSALSIAGLADLVLLLFGETNAEEAHVVTIGGLHISEGLDERVPLLDKRLQLVGSEVHACYFAHIHKRKAFEYHTTLFSQKEDRSRPLAQS